MAAAYEHHERERQAENGKPARMNAASRYIMFEPDVGEDPQNALSFTRPYRPARPRAGAL